MNAISFVRAAEIPVAARPRSFDRMASIFAASD